MRRKEILPVKKLVSKTSISKHVENFQNVLARAMKKKKQKEEEEAKKKAQMEKDGIEFKKELKELKE